MVKRVAVFAAFDGNGKIHRYVQTYLKELKKFAQKIIFVSDNDISAEELKKIDPFADAALCQKHGEYDFGSYKRGIAFARENRLLENADELILCNDSCFCVGDLSVLFNCSDDCDFYGASLNTEFKPHLQSFFFVFKRNVFLSNTFISFFESVRRETDNKQVVLTYEVPLTSILKEQGFKEKAYYSSPKGTNITLYPVTSLSKYDFPLLKKKIFVLRRYSRENLFKLRNILKRRFPQRYEEIRQYFGATKHDFFIFNIYLQRLLSFFFLRKKTSSGKIIVKICKIPVFVSKDKGASHVF